MGTSIREGDSPIEIVELTTEEYDAFLGDEVRGWQESMTLPEFIAAYRGGELDDSDPEVARLVALMGLGQNGR